MKFWVTLEGREAEVALRAEHGKLWLDVEGRRLEADFQRLPDGEVYSLLVNGRSHEVRIAPANDHLEVTTGGATLPVEVRHPLEKALLAVSRARGTRGGEVVAAPMPGLVIAVRVQLGEHVRAGQAVAVIEAMKMQNELAARHDGVVADVLVEERAPVAAGQPLVRLVTQEV